jgi:hypothetical protein
MRLTSASIAATAVITAARGTQTLHGGGETHDPFAGFEGLVDECSRERATAALVCQV